MKALSELAFIEVKDNSNPMKLFKEWLDEFKNYSLTTSIIMNIATATKNGFVSNRNVLLREFIEDEGVFTFVTNSNSKKFKQMNENNRISATFLWNYKNNNEKNVTKQIRIEGIIQQLPNEIALKYYENEPLFCKIRSEICQQLDIINWDDLKKKHDQVLKEVVDEGRQLKMPDCQVAYKILPSNMEFYYSWENCIADRILFKKSASNATWVFNHLPA